MEISYMVVILFFLTPLRLQNALMGETQSIKDAVSESLTHCIATHEQNVNAFAALKVRPEHLLTTFHTILIVEFGGHVPTSPSF